MKRSLLDMIKLILPMGAAKRSALQSASPYLSPEEQRMLRQLLKLDRTFPVQQRFGTTAALFEDREWPYFKSHLKDEKLQSFLAQINDNITGKVHAESFAAFAPVALERIGRIIAPNIIGMERLKEAVGVQLFAREPIHILLIGDPGTGKTDILRSMSALAPIASFGLGSGTSGAGLSAMAKGDLIIKGLLPLADGGIACIDELNLMKAKDMAALYNAMEKGFVTLDKGSKHEQIPARVRVCATANPAGDTFIGRSAEVLRKQIPFDDALLSRFHLIYLVRKPTEQEFEQIATHIIRSDKKRAVSEEDAAFIKAYVAQAAAIDVELDQDLEHELLSFIRELKADQHKFIVEIGPRTVVGIVRLVKAMARAEHANQVTKAHVAKAEELLRKALYVRGDQ
jgi:replicative DNA helicase Mcm